MPTEFTSHFFLLPQNMPLLISCSISGWSVAAAHPGDCWAAYRSRARITAELPTVQPNASEASWLRPWSTWAVSRLKVWVRGYKGCFRGVGLRVAIERDHISPRHAMLRREQIVTRTTNGRAQCLYPSFDSDLSLSPKRDNFDAKR
jgi:hypothetical protein